MIEFHRLFCKKAVNGIRFSDSYLYFYMYLYAKSTVFQIKI